MDNEMNFEVIENTEVEASCGNDLQEKLEEAGTLSEKACIAIGALALAGAVALGNCAYKGGKAAVGKVKAWNESRKAKKADKAEEKDEKAAEESSKESKEDPEKK